MRGCEPSARFVRAARQVLRSAKSALLRMTRYNWPLGVDTDKWFYAF
jgi:hypothetical protein